MSANCRNIAYSGILMLQSIWICLLMKQTNPVHIECKKHKCWMFLHYEAENNMDLFVLAANESALTFVHFCKFLLQSWSGFVCCRSKQIKLYTSWGYTSNQIQFCWPIEKHDTFKDRWLVFLEWCSITSEILRLFFFKQWVQHTGPASQWKWLTSTSSSWHINHIIGSLDWTSTLDAMIGCHNWNSWLDIMTGWHDWMSSSAHLSCNVQVFIPNVSNDSYVWSFSIVSHVCNDQVSQNCLLIWLWRVKHQLNIKTFYFELRFQKNSDKKKQMTSPQGS